MTPHSPRPPILANIPRRNHAVIAASAGTGKTFAIENLVIDLLLDGVSLDEILVLTFTERAADELRKRIRCKIEEILFDPCRESSCQQHKPESVWWIDEKAERRLNEALALFDAASIGTIHGFFGGILLEHAFDNTRLFDGKLEDGRTLFRRAFMMALRRSFALQTSGLADLLVAWLEQSNGGIDGLEDLLYKCKTSRSVILPAFSLDGFQRELETNPLFEIDLEGEAERFKTALKGAGFTHGGSLNSIVNRLGVLAGLIEETGRNVRTFLDERFREAVSFIGERIPARALGDQQATRIAQAILRLKSHIVPVQGAIVQTYLPAVQTILEHQKARTGEFDYDDIISDVAMALDGPRGKELTRAMRSRYRFALIDEFQDTDELQWSFFHRVFLDSGGRNFINLIGDPKQAIYGFRGADVFTYYKACDELKRAGAPRVSLSENFRSTRALIDACNHILDASAPVPFFDGRNTYDEPVKHGQELVAEEPGGSLPVPIHLLKVGPSSGRLEVAELRQALARQIAREVRRILSAEQGLRFGRTGKTEPIKPNDVFILTAKNKEAIEISRALREVEVPFAFYKQDGLFQTKEACQVHDLLAAIDDPADRTKRGRAWITPFFTIPLASLPALADLTDSHPLVERLTWWKEEAEKGRFERMFTRILDESGVIRRELFLSDSERALTNYLHLFEILLEEARATGYELADLVATLNGYIQDTRRPRGEDGNVQRLETDRAAVQIMTIHKSKGLEAAVVFLYGGFTPFRSDGMHRYHRESGQRVLDFGDEKSAKETFAQEQKEEFQRLYYVAMTRAKARLYLPYIAPEHWDHRSWRGGYRQVNERLSQVVANLTILGKEHLFQIVEVRDRWPGPGSAKGEQPGPDPASWHPDPPLSEESDDVDRFRKLRWKHAGYQVTSYSRMKSALSGDGELVPLGRDELDDEPMSPPVMAPLPEGELPGGTATGLMLHEILEQVPFDSFTAAPTLEAWRTHEEVSGVIAAAMARNAVNPVHRANVETMVHHALTMEIPTSRGLSIPGFCRCDKHLREMEFLFPDPEDSHPPLSDAAQGKLVIQRGFIKGFVDLVVEHHGLVYFADWKSDILVSYRPETVEEHVALHYKIQIQLYVMSIVKALGVHSESEYKARFGGLVYVFLRGLVQSSDQKQGVYFRRPSWSQVLSFEKDIKRMRNRTAGGRS
jgi:exodeoxyribonuclease V beta subunit